MTNNASPVVTLKKYDSSGIESEHGCFVLYEEHLKAIQDSYAKGVSDCLSKPRNLDELDKVLDKIESQQ